MASSTSTTQPTLAQIAEALLRGEINNIIHDTLIHRHRDHKLMLTSLDPTTKLPHCDSCGLPKLLAPPLAPSVRSAAHDLPSDTVYCDKKPWCRKPGHDIYGNPFPKADITGRPPTKKEREAAKNNTANKNNGDGTPASNEGGDTGINGTAPPSPTPDEPSKLEKGEKKASKIDEKLKKGEYIPWQTCPNCKRSLLITRFAKHLEQCMGLSGRAASRNAMAKMNGTVSAAGSRGGTPGPEGAGNGGEDEEEDEGRIKGPGGVRKKVLKKGLNSKLKKAEKEKNGGGMTNGVKGSKPISTAAANTNAGGGGEGKRDREEMLLGDEGDEEENVHVKKRQKLQRVESMASLVSESSAPPPSAVEMERGESQEGSSFVDDGGGGFEDD